MRVWILVVWDNFGKIENSKVRGFWHIFCEAEIHAISKPWDAPNYHITEEVWEKTISRLCRTDLELNLQISIRWRYSVECHIISRVWGLQKITSIFPISWKIYRDTHICATHECEEIFPVNPYEFTIPKTWKKSIPMVRKKYVKTQIFEY